MEKMAHKRKKTESKQAEGYKKRKSSEKAIIAKDGSQHFSGSDEDNSDLDLEKDLKPIDAFLKETPEILFNEIFIVLTKAKVLVNMLPDVVKKCSTGEFKKSCIEQLEIMSKNRIKCILAGEPMSSSSDTEDELMNKTKEQVCQSNTWNIADSTTQQEIVPNRQAEDLSWTQGEREVEEVIAKEKEPALTGGDELEIHADSPFSEDSYSCNTGCIQNKRLKVIGQPGCLEAQCSTTTTTTTTQTPPGQRLGQRQVSSVADGEQAHAAGGGGASSSTRQLELLELEMRARAIRSLLKAKEKHLISDPPSSSAQVEVTENTYQ